ncbi:MAG: PAS domain-containing protein [Pseudolabrys sp.]
MLRASDGLVDLLPIATFICDAGGAILQYNGRAVEIWGGAPEPGWTHDEFTRNCSFFTLDARPAAYSMVSEVLMSRTPVRDVERVLERADGTRVVVSVNIDPLRDANGALVGAVNYFLDITECKRVAAALEHSRRR